jgi:hypothetical protein
MMAILYLAVRLALVLWLLRLVWEMARLMLNEFK